MYTCAVQPAGGCCDGYVLGSAFSTSLLQCLPVGSSAIVYQCDKSAPPPDPGCTSCDAFGSADACRTSGLDAYAEQNCLESCHSVGAPSTPPAAPGVPVCPSCSAYGSVDACRASDMPSASIANCVETCFGCAFEALSFEQIDANGDGVLSVQELTSAGIDATQLLSQLDANNDGELSSDESGCHDIWCSSMFTQVDTTGDGMLSAQELSNSGLGALAPELDANNDGELSLDEACLPPPPPPCLCHTLSQSACEQ